MHVSKRRRNVLALIVSLGLSSLSLSFSACSSRKSSSSRIASQPFATVLVSSRLIAAVDQQTLTERLASVGIVPRNGIKIYRLSYNTEGFEGAPTLASGVVLIPDTGAKAYPWISLQHGTLTSKADAPSLDPREGLAESSQGFVTVVADYLGYGDSAQVYHPYILEEGYTSSLVDMMRAARELATTQSFALGPLFLKGYSEGGYATVALQKVLETDHSEEFPIVASSASAGPLDVDRTGTLVVQKSTVNPSNIPFLILSYDHWLADDTLPLASMFVPSLETVTRALSGAYDADQISGLLPSNTTELFNATFVNDFISPVPVLPESVQLHSLLKSQSLLKGSWIPKTPTRFYHCVDDDEIPVAITEEATRYFQAAGAPVESVIIPSPDPAKPYRHGTCPAIFTPLQWFGQILSKPSKPSL